MILSDEFLKLKRIKGMHMLYVFPLLMCFIQLYEIIKACSSNNGSVINSPFSHVYIQLYSLFSPFIAILLIFTIIQIENKNNMWESNFMLPISKTQIYLKKIIVSFIIIFAFVAISYITYLLSLFICKIFYEIPFTFVDNQLLVIFFSKMFLALILYAFIALPLFIFIESPVTSIGFLTFFILLGMFFTKKSWFDFYPFSYCIIAVKDISLGKWAGFMRSDFIVITYIVVSTISGFFMFNKFKK